MDIGEKILAAAKKAQKVEIRCAHPLSKRWYCESGWMCETGKGGCGATGSGTEAHYNPVIAYYELPGDDEVAAADRAAAAEFRADCELDR